MKPRFWLATVCWALVCLVLGLSQQAGLYHSSQVSGSSQWLDRCREPASGSPTASVVESTQFDPARAGPLTSLVLEDSWSKGNIGPPGQETHGPPKTIGIWRLPVKDRSSKQQRATLPKKFLTQPTEFEESGVLQHPLAKLGNRGTSFRNGCLNRCAV
jgi:hypothetical protein